MSQNFLDYRFSEDLFKNIRKIKLIISLAMIVIGAIFSSLVNPLASLSPVGTRPFYITLGTIILSGGGLYGIIIGFKTLLESLKNSNVIKRDRITYNNGLIKYYKSIYYQPDEHTNGHTEHYVYKIETKEITKVKENIFSYYLYGNFSKTLQEKDIEGNNYTKNIRKVIIPKYFKNFNEIIKTLTSWEFFFPSFSKTVLVKI